MHSNFPVSEENRVLELDTRRNIYNLVQKFAGCHFRELERISGLPTGTLKYHLNYLSRHGLIKEEKYGNKLLYFPRQFKSENKILLGLLRQKSVRDILLFILTHQNCNHEDIVQFVDLSPSTVSWHLKKLEDSEIVVSAKDGRNTYYKILIDEDEIINLLVTYKESFFDSLVDRVIEMWDIS